MRIAKPISKEIAQVSNSMLDSSCLQLQAPCAALTDVECPALKTSFQEEMLEVATCIWCRAPSGVRHVVTT